jgi:hypothetical protein
VRNVLIELLGGVRIACPLKLASAHESRSLYI